MSTRTSRPGERYTPKPARAAVAGDLARGVPAKPAVPAKPPTRPTGPTGPRPHRGPGMSKPVVKQVAKRASRPATRDGAK